MRNFWIKLNRPFFCLAPMADVTDCAFRKVIANYGKPDVFWTEFVSADGLAHPKARGKLLIDLKFSKDEHPIVAQIFGANPENIKEAAVLCRELGFDGVDINMGCPDRTIEKQGAGAAMIKNPKLAREIIRAAKEGAEGLPVSVKTRIGYSKVEIETWLPEILKGNLAALTIHLRTRKEMSDVPAHWELMKRIVEIRDEISPETLLIGNGDVVSLEDARAKTKEYGCDGVMLGRAIFGNPWLFRNLTSTVFSSLRPPSVRFRSPKRDPREQKNSTGEVSLKEKLKVLIEHTKLFEKEFKGIKSFDVMKKHYKAYVNGFDGAKELRIKLMETKNVRDVEKIVKDFLEKM